MSHSGRQLCKLLAAAGAELQAGFEPAELDVELVDIEAAVAGWAATLLQQSAPGTGLAEAEPELELEPPFAMSASSFVTAHNQNNEQRDRADAPKALRATRALAAAALVYIWRGGTSAAASHWTLQVGRGAHIDLAADELRHINHACEPNVVMRGLRFETLRDIAAQVTMGASSF